MAVTPSLISGSSARSIPPIELPKELPQDEAGWERLFKYLRDEVKVAARDEGPNSGEVLQRAQHALRNAENAKQLQDMERERAQAQTPAAEQPS